ncbi:hypothetical protein [Citreimonas sp.]|uniref:hypothetical protein n=1 Tax=Citreimonas sp. TaxID=3036715 RepID=UPI0040589CC9
MTDAATETADAALRDRAGELSDWTAQLFDWAEPAWREYRSSDWYVRQLRAEGFTVEQGTAGMPTAFCAEWHNGPGPVIGMYAEYDAVPGNSQAPRPEQAPRDGTGEMAAGHTDPHSALGTGALAGLLATKAAMQAHGIPGGLRFTGEPAEKVRGSKPLHAAAGYYDGLAAMLSFHPFYMLPLCNTVRWDTHCGAAYSFVYRFRCDAPQDWGARDGAPIPQSHSDIRAPGANDALMTMYQTARALRDSMLPHRGGWSVSEAILATGQATADNLPALRADLQYMIRVPDLGMAEQITAQLDRLAEHSAAVTGCSSKGTGSASRARALRTTRWRGWSGTRCATRARPNGTTRRATWPSRSSRPAATSPTPTRCCPNARVSSTPKRPRPSCAATCRRRRPTAPRTTTPT